MGSRRRWACVAAVAAVVGAAGCTGDRAGPGPGGAAAILAAAPDRTSAAGSARASVHAAVEGQVKGTLAGEGALDLAGGRGRLVLDLGPLGLAGAGRTDVVYDGDVLFIELGRALPQLASRPWLRVDLAAVGAGPGDSIEALRQIQTNYPPAVLQFLRGVRGDVEVVGPEDVRGTATTRYRATVDLPKAAGAAPREARDAIGRVRRQLGEDTLPVEAWLDGEGRVRRLRYTVDLAELSDSAPAKGAGAGRSTADLELYDFGAAAVVTAPDAAEVTDLDVLLGLKR